MYVVKYYSILVMFPHIFDSTMFWRCFVLNWPFLSSNRMFFNIQSYKSCDARKGKVMAIYVHYFCQFWFRFYNSLSFNLSWLAKRLLYPHISFTMEMYMNQDDLQHMYRINLQIEFYSIKTERSDWFCMIYFKIQNTALEDP